MLVVADCYVGLAVMHWGDSESVLKTTIARVLERIGCQNPRLDNIRAVGFDLDGTLYSEESFVREAYREISRHLSGKHGLDQEILHDKLLGRWRQKGSRYPGIFTELLEEYGLRDSTAGELVQIYNDVDVELDASPHVLGFLQTLKNSGYGLFLVTDGNPERQARKVQALGLRTIFDMIVYTDILGKAAQKPSPLGFTRVMEHFACQPEHLLFIGDHQVDVQAAERAGVDGLKADFPLIEAAILEAS
jgi:putative hydrolase of the HAD superfamily